jgi:acetyltransferase-like isoleucine patch superfamily enzyme
MGAHILGDIRTQPNCGLPQSYFEGRDCFLDCREPDMLHISGDANIGWENHLITQTHDITPGNFGRLFGRRITIGAKAFVTSFCTLFNCTIGEGAVVATGSVVRSMIVPAWTMVEGNPAKIIKKYNFETCKWERVLI